MNRFAVAASARQEVLCNDSKKNHAETYVSAFHENRRGRWWSIGMRHNFTSISFYFDPSIHIVVELFVPFCYFYTSCHVIKQNQKMYFNQSIYFVFFLCASTFFLFFIAFFLLVRSVRGPRRKRWKKWKRISTTSMSAMTMIAHMSSTIIILHIKTNFTK